MATPKYKSIFVGQEFPTLKWGPVKVLAVVNSSRIDVEFILSGCKRSTSAMLLRQGRVIDNTKLPSLVVGSVHPSNGAGDFKIVEYVHCNKIKIEFLGSGYSYYVKGGNIRKGGVMDPSTGRSMRGFNPQLKGWFYVQALIQDGQVKAYKFGITNRDPKERMKEHVNGSQYEHIIIAQTEFSIGSNAAALELEVKQKLDTWYLGREELPHGFTETINPCLIDELMAIHNNFQTTQ